MFAAVIFDRDGVLTHFDINAGVAYFESLLPISVYELSDRWQQWGNRVGFPRDLGEEKAFWHGFWEHLGNEFSLPQTIKRQLHRVDYRLFLKPFPDARTALLKAQKQGLRVGVLSNFTLASLETSLSAVGFGGLVDVALAAPVIGAYKPDIAAYEAMMQALDVRPEQCLFFDDEQACVEGARASGIQTYLVDRNRTDHNLAESVICDLSALSCILDQAPLTQVIKM
jgi:HAD superfamily hydrolase (TIGR01509 family)